MNQDTPYSTLLHQQYLSNQDQYYQIQQNNRHILRYFDLDHTIDLALERIAKSLLLPESPPNGSGNVMLKSGKLKK